ncbi:MAG: hypothetical protein WC810_03070 [Janthinobacterium sp.]
MILAEQSLAKKDPFSLIEDGHLSIKTKSGELVKFTLNRAQEYVLGIIKQLWRENKIIRLWILKARQLGLSTLIEAIIYALTSQKENVNALIVADDDDGSNYIFEMSKLYQEKCPEHLKPKEKKSNEKKLEFEGHSQILIDTARNKNAGRNYTFQYAHLSNYAYFPYPDEIMAGLNNSVPALPRTMIIKETTAKGPNFAKEEWKQAKNGEIDYTTIFIPWYWDDGYKMSVDNFIIGDISLGDITIDEPLLSQAMIKEGIGEIEERLAWRRWKIKNDCKGDIFAFKQEFPSTDDESFEGIVGNPRFSISALNQLRRRCKAPTRGDLVYENGQITFQTNQYGIVEVYNFPTDATRGVVGVDIAEGIGKDRSSASFVNYDTLTEDIVINSSKLDPSQFAIQIWLLGKWCNDAQLIIESNGPGLACILPLVNGHEINGVKYKSYRNIYYKEILDQDKKKTKKYGWNTNQKTRPIQIDTLAEFIREGLITIPSEDTVREAQCFIIDEKGDTHAVEGTTDDRILALSIACMGYKLRSTISLPSKAPTAAKVY